MFETTRWGMLKTAPEKPIGLDSIQEQVRQKLIRFGLAFNVMVVGRPIILVQLPFRFCQ